MSAQVKCFSCIEMVCLRPTTMSFISLIVLLAIAMLISCQPTDLEQTSDSISINQQLLQNQKPISNVDENAALIDGEYADAGRRRTKRDASCCAHRNACVLACQIFDKCLSGYCSGECGTCTCTRCLFRG